MSHPYVMITAKDLGVDRPDVSIDVLRRACCALRYGVSNEPMRLVNARGETSKAVARRKLQVKIDEINNSWTPDGDEEW